MPPSARWVAIVFAGAFVWFTAWAVFLNPHHLPLSQDEVAYVFQARIFAGGRMAVAPARVPEGFDAEAICTHGGRRFAGYPPGLPLVLAAFHHLAAMWLAAPFVVALTAALLFSTTWRLAGPTAAAVALGCALLSRAFVCASAIYVSEPLAMLSAVVLARAVLTGAGGLALAGALFLVRPVTAAALVGCTFLAVDNRRRAWLALSSVLGFAAAAALSSAIAGVPTTELYRFWGQTFIEAGWTPALALTETGARIATSLVDAVPQGAPLLAVWAAVRRRPLWIVPAMYLALAGVHAVRITSGHAFIGARYLVPAAPLSILAAAVLFVDLAQSDGHLRRFAVGVLGLGLIQLAVLDGPLHRRALAVRSAMDPRSCVPPSPARTLVLCRTEHFERERPGYRADDYYMGFDANGLEESGDLLFAREVDGEVLERLKREHRPERVLTVEWHAGPDGPRCRVLAPR